MKSYILLVGAIILSACSTQHAKLDEFVDKDIRDVIAVYGQPLVAFQMEENRRDFQWVLDSGHIPAYSVSGGALMVPEKQLGVSNENETITPLFDNKPITSECIYTLISHWDADAQRWIVTSYQKPVPGC